MSTSTSKLNRPFARVLALTTAASLLTSSLLYVEGLSFAPNNAAGFVSRDTQPNEFPWLELTPSADLVWHSCYDGLQCARLIVPLDHFNASVTEKAVIAVTRFPAALPVNSTDYRGPILINPGGPGGSGVDIIVTGGELFAGIIGPQFDIIGFDPRGIARSTPRADFFGTPADRALWEGPIGPLTALNATSDGLARAWARAKIAGQLAEERQSDVLPYINTAQTAADMLSIIKAHGNEKLLYWGFSYGSILGSTYASMFPNNIERLVIDGVPDIESYQTLHSNSLRDTAKTMDAFYTTCHAAGSMGCAFYAPTPELIAANLSALYASVRARPVPVRTAISYGLVDYSRLRATVFTSLYMPWATWSTLATALADLARGNGTGLYAMLETPPFECDCGKEDLTSVIEGVITVSCNDGDAVPQDFEQLEKYFKETTTKSEWAELWDGLKMSCVGWPSFPKAFRGPFQANTSFPLLVIGNTADPVTPLWGAKKTAQGFPGAVVLTQDSPGHCSIAAPSVCTQTHIRDYFVNGTLPPTGTVCSVPGSPFDEPTTPGSKSPRRVDAFLAEDTLQDAVRKLSTSRWLSRPL